jgi:hypothetical protein
LDAGPSVVVPPIAIAPSVIAVIAFVDRKSKSPRVEFTLFRHLQKHPTEEISLVRAAYGGRKVSAEVWNWKDINVGGRFCGDVGPHFYEQPATDGGERMGGAFGIIVTDGWYRTKHGLVLLRKGISESRIPC